MHQQRLLALATAATLCVMAVAGTGMSQTNSKEIMALDPTRLVMILKNPDAPLFQKAKACQRLAVVGTKDAVPALVALLPHDQLNLYARFALEGIPDPAVDDALCQEVARQKGRALVGVVNSIGQRRSEKGISALEGLLASANADVASAAAGALGRIGTTKAARVLMRALLDQPSVVKPWIGDACLACAEQLAVAGNREGALTLYEAVAKADLPKHLPVASTGGQLRLLKSDAMTLLRSLVASDDEAKFRLGLAAAREVSGADVTASLAEMLTKLPPERQALLLVALGDRKDRLALSTVTRLAREGAPVVRQAAVEVLAKIGDASTAGVLIESAVSEGPAAAAAKEGLQSLAGQDVDAAIVARMAGASGKAKAVLCELVGARRIVAALPAIRQATTDSDASTRHAAITALAQLIELKDLGELSRLAFAAGSADADAAREALTTAALRMGDRDGCANLLEKTMQDLSIPDRQWVLQLLGKVSGTRAVEIVAAAAHSRTDEIKDSATQVLGDWANPDAAPALLAIAKAEGSGKYGIRALRGYIRIARQLQLPDDVKLEMFRTAVATATRAAEKQLAMDVLTRVPSVTSLQTALSYLGDRGLRDQAADAAVKIARPLISSSPREVAAAMQKVLDAQVSETQAANAKELLDKAKAAAK